MLLNGPFVVAHPSFTVEIPAEGKFVCTNGNLLLLFFVFHRLRTLQIIFPKISAYSAPYLANNRPADIHIGPQPASFGAEKATFYMHL